MNVPYAFLRLRRIYSKDRWKLVCSEIVKHTACIPRCEVTTVVNNTSGDQLYSKAFFKSEIWMICPVNYDLSTRDLIIGTNWLR